MKIGTHVSAAGGAHNAPLNAHKLGCECYQFFSRPPQGGDAPKLSQEIIKKIKENNKKYNFKDFYIHAPYYINLASSKKNVYYGSISVLREELERCSQLGAKYLMTHLGSAKDLGDQKAIQQITKGISEVLKNYIGSCGFLIEISAGSGQIIGNTFEEIAKILSKLKNKINICYDTAHAFESGYDMRDKKSIKNTLNEFDKIIGLDKLKLIHVNDSKSDLGSHIDRHEHIGKGKIGLAGFKALLSEKKFTNINLILETPADYLRINDIKILKDLR